MTSLWFRRLILLAGVALPLILAACNHGSGGAPAY